MANAPIEIIPVCDFRVRGKNEKTHTHKHKHIYVFVWVCVHLLALMTNNRNIYEDIWTRKKNLQTDHIARRRIYVHF